MSETERLQGKVAVVTGGGRGIGAAIAARLAAMGAQTIICGRRARTLEAAAASIAASGGRCLPLPCDVTRWADVEALARAITDRFQGLDILVNNAGIAGPGGPLHEADPAAWDLVFNTNLRGVFYCIRAFAPLMISRGGGDIVNISSIAGKNPLPNGAIYAASKWGLNGLSYSVTEELREHGIRVSVVCPGSTISELTPHRGKRPERMLTGEDVAHAVAMIVTQQPRAFASEVVLRPTRKP
jgi:3-oxoacyl-[acyl-carrier protein] reductase